MDEEADYAAHITALHSLVRDALEIIHRIDPDAVRAKLQTERVLVQSVEAGRFETQSPKELQVHRLRLAAFERAVAQTP